MIFLMSCFSTAPAPEPPAAEPAAPAVDWPAPSVDGIPGWVAFAVSTEANPYEEAPVLTDASAYTAPGGHAWEGVPSGTGLLAVHPGGQGSLTLTEVADRPLGCDGMQQPLTLLTGPSMRPGPIWLLPPQSTDARALQFKATTTQTEKRAWRVDGVEVAVVKTGTHTAELRVSGTALKTINTAEVMDGAEVEEVDLTGFTLYADTVVAAWQLPEVGRVALTRWPSLEGAHYDLIELDRAVLHQSIESIYLCAF